MKNKILFVSIALTPKNDPECIQAGRYLYYLQEVDDWEFCTVTSAAPTLFMPHDKSLEFYTAKIKQNILIKIPENKYINYLIRRINKLILETPDSKFLFHLQWKKVKRAVKDIDLIYSRSFPLSSTIMAYKLKKYYNVPWVMHLSDPWCESPLAHYSNKSLAYHEEWEKKCFEKADLISFTTGRTLDLYVTKYPKLKDKFKVFPNVYDPTELNRNKGNLEQDSNGSNKVTIVYTGGLANTRTAEVFINALNLLAKQENQLEHKLEVIFAGDMDAPNRDLFTLSELSFLRHVGTLSSTEASKLQMKADILLVIDSKIENIKQNVFFPSKLLDYASKNKFILGITEPNSPTYEFISKNNGVIFSFDEEEKIASWIKEALSNTSAFKGQNEIDEYYSAKKQAHILSDTFKKLLNER